MLMMLLVTDDHGGEGDFPTFPRGARVENIEPCGEEAPHWLACTIDAKKTYVPDIYVAGDALVADYNPTELVLAKGATVELVKVVHDWLLVKTADGATGWLPACKVISVLA